MKCWLLWMVKTPNAADGSQSEARFCISRIRASALAYGFSFFCEHQTPQAIWQPAWQVHPNGVQALSAFVISSPQPEQTLALYRQMFSSEVRAEACGGYVLNSGTCSLRIITHQQASLEFALPPVAAQAPRHQSVAVVAAGISHYAHIYRLHAESSAPTARTLSAECGCISCEICQLLIHF